MQSIRAHDHDGVVQCSAVWDPDIYIYIVIVNDYDIDEAATFTFLELVVL